MVTAHDVSNVSVQVLHFCKPVSTFDGHPQRCHTRQRGRNVTRKIVDPQAQPHPQTFAPKLASIHHDVRTVQISQHSIEMRAIMRHSLNVAKNDAVHLTNALKKRLKGARRVRQAHHRAEQ
jgi:hypothetical protein